MRHRMLHYIALHHLAGEERAREARVEDERRRVARAVRDPARAAPVLGAESKRR